MSTDGNTRKHHEGQKPITLWLPEAQAAALDQKLQAQVAGIIGAKVSRQAYLTALIAADIAGTAPAAAAVPAAAPAALPAPSPQDEDDRAAGAALRAYFELTKDGNHGAEGCMFFVSALKAIVDALRAGRDSIWMNEHTGMSSAEPPPPSMNEDDRPCEVPLYGAAEHLREDLPYIPKPKKEPKRPRKKKEPPEPMFKRVGEE